MKFKTRNLGLTAKDLGLRTWNVVVRVFNCLVLSVFVSFILISLSL